VIFVLEWPNGEFVSLIGFILFTKSLLCNVAIINRVTVLFRISSLSEFIFLKIERVLLWQVQYHKHQEGNFRSFGKILCSWQLNKSRIPCFRMDGPGMHPDDLQCLKYSDKFSIAFVQTSGQHVRTLFSVRERFQFSFAYTDRERQLATVRTRP